MGCSFHLYHVTWLPFFNCILSWLRCDCNSSAHSMISPHEGMSHVQVTSCPGFPDSRDQELISHGKEKRGIHSSPPFTIINFTGGGRRRDRILSPFFHPPPREGHTPCHLPGKALPWQSTRAGSRQGCCLLTQGPCNLQEGGRTQINVPAAAGGNEKCCAPTAPCPELILSNLGV